jgi:hypothetical protein
MVGTATFVGAALGLSIQFFSNGVRKLPLMRRKLFILPFPASRLVSPPPPTPRVIFQPLPTTKQKALRLLG